MPAAPGGATEDPPYSTTSASLIGREERGGGGVAASARKWTITIEQPHDADAPLGSPQPRRVEKFASEPEEEAHVLKALAAAGLPPGSPAAKVASRSPVCSPLLSAVASPARRLSQASHHSEGSKEDGGAQGVVEDCLLFPGVRCEAGAEQWVPRLNRLLRGGAALPLQEFGDAMDLFAQRSKDEAGCPTLTVAAAGDAPLRVVGDVHGQLACLLHRVFGPVLRKEAPPCRWLFLGDLVDRGAQGAECLTIIALLRVCYPSSVMVIRGNHEDAALTNIYGFRQECEMKYPSADGCWAWYSANLAFVEMPVACVVRHVPSGKKFFCCHGGLSAPLVCADPAHTINTMARRKYGQESLSELVLAEAPSSPLGCLSENQFTCIQGLLWSDPHDHDEQAEWLTSTRGAGQQWGAQASASFCEQGGFDFICRAHQMNMAGFQWQHHERVLTVFSAADYCGCKNDGAVLVVRPDWSREVVTFEPPDVIPTDGGPAPGPLLPYFCAPTSSEASS